MLLSRLTNQIMLTACLPVIFQRQNLTIGVRQQTVKILPNNMTTAGK